MLKKILVPLDGSDLAEQALAPAFTLARAGGAEVLLLRSVFLVNMMLPVFAHEYEWAWPEYSREEGRAEARSYLTQLQETFADEDSQVRVIVTEGDPASDIVDTAVAEGVDLIVMSTHGWSGARRWIMGSVTERVLESAPCPVYIARAVRHLTQIIITLDGSKVAEHSLPIGIELARLTDAHVSLLRVVEPVPARLKDDMEISWRQRETQKSVAAGVREHAESYLFRIVKRLKADYDRHVNTMVVEGHTVEGILDCARLHGADLIVMTTHGLTGLRRWHYGSVTGKVMRSADCSVLVIRPPEQMLNGE